jgi:hypothetical protein
MLDLKYIYAEFGTDIVGLQVLLQNQHAAFIRAVYVDPWTLSVCKTHRTWGDAMLCSAMEVRCSSFHAESGMDTSVTCAV